MPKRWVVRRGKVRQVEPPLYHDDLPVEFVGNRERRDVGPCEFVGPRQPQPGWTDAQMQVMKWVGVYK